MDMSALDLPLDDTGEMLREAIRRLLADTPEPGWDDLAAKLGLAGLTVPERSGGFGGGVVEVALTAAELGPALAASAWLSHAAACHALGAVAGDHPLLPALAEGRDRAALVSVEVLGNQCHARLVPGAASASVLVVTDGSAVALLAPDAPGLERRARAMLDGSEAADLVFAGAVLEPLGRLPQGISPAALVEAGRCAEAVGIMARMMAETAAWLGERKQFGASIASFQALRHRFADMQMATMQARALTEQAVIALACGKSDAEDAALAAAAVMVRDAARVVGEGAVQLHGAMGLTEELRLGARFKRLLALAAALGSEEALLARFAAAA